MLSHNLRTKTVRSIIDHITDTLPIPGEGIWEPLSLDYIKCLTSLLQYPPHVEHLADPEWEKLVKFCVTAINLQRNDESQLSIRSAHRSVLGDDLDSSDGRSTPARMTPAPSSKEKYVGDRKATGEMILCIQLLCGSPSAPVQASAESILQSLAEFVKFPSNVAGNSHQLAFSSINSVVSKILLDQSDLARPYLIDLLPTIRRLWTTKLQSLKDELLISLMMCTIILTDSAESPSETLAYSVGDLVETLLMEYTKRNEKDLLQADEIALYSTAPKGFRSIYGPRFSIPRSEYLWTVIWVISTLLKLSDSMNTWLSSAGAVAETSNKRQRLSSALEDTLREATSAQGARRICALQLIPFLENAVDAEEKEALVSRLIPYIVDDNNSISSWTMIALTRSVISHHLLVLNINSYPVSHVARMPDYLPSKDTGLAQ